ncbi:centrosome-associated protein ALMS1-like [Molossus nigricans]
MEPEDLPWPGELEEEEEEEEGEEEEVAAENLDEDEVVMVEDVEEEERRELDADFNFESPPRESTDDEEDEEDDEAKAWLQAHPGGTQPPPLPKHRYSEGERTGPEKVGPAGGGGGAPSGRGGGSSLPTLTALPPARCLSPCLTQDRRAF